MKPLTEVEAKKRVCPYDGSKCGASICMAWVKSQKETEGYCVRLYASVNWIKCPECEANDIELYKDS